MRPSRSLSISATVESVEVHQVGSGLELDLIEAAGAEELPDVLGHGPSGWEWTGTLAIAARRLQALERQPRRGRHDLRRWDDWPRGRKRT